MKENKIDSYEWIDVIILTVMMLLIVMSSYKIEDNKVRLNNNEKRIEILEENISTLLEETNNG